MSPKLTKSPPSPVLASSLSLSLARYLARPCREGRGRVRIWLARSAGEGRKGRAAAGGKACTGRRGVRREGGRPGGVQASCKYLPRSCCPTAPTVRHKHSTDKHAYRCLFHRALQCRQWDNSCEEDIYMKPGHNENGFWCLIPNTYYYRYENCLIATET